MSTDSEFLIAAKLFESGELSAGKAAQRAGMERMRFLRELERIGVPAINLYGEEAEAEVQAARDSAR